MNRGVGFIVITLVLGIPAVVLGRVIWPDPAGAPQPAAGLVPLFVIESLIESLTFGAGVAFLAYGLPLVRSFGQPPALTWLTFLSVDRWVISWWPRAQELAALAEAEAGYKAEVGTRAAKDAAATKGEATSRPSKGQGARRRFRPQRSALPTGSTASEKGGYAAEA